MSTPKKTPQGSPVSRIPDFQSRFNIGPDKEAAKRSMFAAVNRHAARSLEQYRKLFPGREPLIISKK